jgi:2-oxoglutarate ferredoxin oxidoreductase subunit alpha
MGASLAEGNEAIGWGALKAGCNLFAGYPITPATAVYNTVLKTNAPFRGHLSSWGGQNRLHRLLPGGFHGRDEGLDGRIGTRHQSLKRADLIAIGSEIPIVIVDVQRLGPSTGSATKGADGDVQFLRWGNSGGLPVIVLAPTTGSRFLRNSIPRRPNLAGDLRGDG